MVKWKPDGKVRSTHIGSGSTVYREIEKDEYERLAALSPAERDDEILGGLSQALICGYGAEAYGIDKTADGYFAGYHVWDSCD